MNKMAAFLLYRGEKKERQNMLWNMVGSFCYAFASMVLSFFVMRMAGEDQGGIFSFGYSTLGQQMFIVAYFGIRPFHITDNQGEYSFQDYRNHRRLTCGAAVLCGLGFLAFMNGTGRYSLSKSLILFLLVLYKVADGWADVYESEFQRQGCLYLTGKSNCFRTILSAGIFLGTLKVSGSLIWACAAGAAAQLGGILLFNRSVIHCLDGVDWRAGSGKIRKLFGSTGLLFLSVFLDFYVFSSAKYAIDARMSDGDSGYFNLIFMPTSVIYLVANFIIRPFLTSMTDLWNRKEYERFKKQLLTIGAVIGGLTVLAVAAALLLGPWVLSVMEFLLGAGYEGSLQVYAIPFAVIVLGGGLYAMANLMYYALVIMRKQTVIFGVYLAAAVLAALISGPMVSWGKIPGAAGCYVLLMAGLTAGFGCFTLGIYCRAKRENQ